MVKPSVAIVIFLSSAISWILSFLIEDWHDVPVADSTDGDDDDIDGVNNLAIHLFKCLGI